MSLINLIGNVCIFGSLASSVVGIFWARKNFGLAKKLIYFNFFAMTLATLGMVYALLTNDFSVSYVAHVGARETPRFFAAISLWSSLEGSILLWGWVLSAYSALCIYLYRDSYADLMPWVAITLFAIGIFFYIVLGIPANPFHEVFPVPPNGPGPNPLLQNHWLMAVHPPMLYLGYVGMSVPFAFAVASMVTGNFGNDWVDITRKWLLTAWMFLSIAIILGGWWSYAVLGWGGYWAWDPVENASFLPWLTATPLLHSIMVQQRRGMLKMWNLSLIVTTFLLTLLGTFLTRSGVLDSVHSFTESGIGLYFLIAIAIALMSSLALLIWKAPQFASTGKFDSPFCRETAFLLGNLLFVCFCFVVLLGTLYPLISEALRGVKVSVGEPFFNQMSLPLSLAIILLMGVGVATPWKIGDKKVFFKTIRWPAVIAVLSIPIVWFFGFKNGWILTTVAFSLFSLSIMLLEMAAKSIQQKSFFALFQNQPRRYGGFVAHIGIIVIAVGVAFSSAYQEEVQATLKGNESLQIGPYTVTLQKLYANQAPQRFEVIAQTLISKNGKPISIMEPKLNYYPTQREPVSTPAIRATAKEDLYLTLMAFDEKGMGASLRAMVTPAVSWIWWGGGIIVLGSLLALSFWRRPKKN
ncbi:MAG: heme lyase CcmF/NrfE family subunit [Deltaproteobacteria bacterium]|nr:heme lyase CcmF/NrfE family subunit [Deltaproteobacteria bacterium]